MLVSHRHRTIFVHIQRTGGNSVQRLFEKLDPELVEAVPVDPARRRTKHCWLQDIAEALDPAVFAAYTKFAIVRNPFDRLLSWYQFLRDGGHAEDAGIPVRDPTDALTAEQSERCERIGDRVMHEVRRHAPSFAHFVRLPREHEDFSRFHACQIDYISLRDRVSVDEVLRFETLDHDFARLAERLGISARLPHRNASSRRAGYREAYDPETRALVEARCARDLAAFGYEF